MASVIEHPSTLRSSPQAGADEAAFGLSLAPPPAVALAPPLAPRETAARRTLRGQIAKLERELAEAAARSTPDDRIVWSTATPDLAGPRLLGLGELERLRDDLAERLHEVRVVHRERAVREALKRDQLTALLRDPARYRFVRITRRDVGEPGCGAWESRPRLGLIGMLAGWWHVKISSGCPLAA
ncbi:hypothetical protein Q5424_22070 [Conexibacter sp. JD483]|uniref:hypothetical protein n=1 Tax=unclassified Conexibacter TaxID=2627773 RepID=UPI002728750F|nr:MULTISPECIES: hypothetical protein [unclassified Conexibacter]MDO8186160.1 hypothetical protein [Conexibacter sp. CPCC 205706]MDO8199650.1 hypothetical protein [Conexibacter sp. CPCC 205762]MDR9371800.1 hypothetical protein [Conexibacter sp. JD483]